MRSLLTCNLSSACTPPAVSWMKVYQAYLALPLQAAEAGKVALAVQHACRQLPAHTVFTPSPRPAGCRSGQSGAGCTACTPRCAGPPRWRARWWRCMPRSRRMPTAMSRCVGITLCGLSNANVWGCNRAGVVARSKHTAFSSPSPHAHTHAHTSPGHQRVSDRHDDGGQLCRQAGRPQAAQVGSAVRCDTYIRILYSYNWMLQIVHVSKSVAAWCQQRNALLTSANPSPQARVRQGAQPAA